MAAKAGSSKGTNIREYTVSELSFGLKKMIESTFDHVRVRGEIGRVSRPGSGHLYLDLKDERSVLAGVIWRGVAERLAIQPEQGLEVVATGKLTTFPGQSKYQIVIEFLEPAGVGALMALLEERKKKLATEGLFDEARKRTLPFLPSVVGIVTSLSGAVIRDMLHGFDERFPTRVLLWPVRVQGEKCAGEVATAIRGFNALAHDGLVQRPDVLIVARGGGSLEDLWGFNEEITVRAAAESQIPIISAVGHETDWTLIDLAADARAPTPTKAAEWAVPRHSELLERLEELDGRLRLQLRRNLEQQRGRLRAASRGLPRLQDLVALPRQRLDTNAMRLERGLVSMARAHAHHLTKVASRLQLPLLVNRLARTQDRLIALALAKRQGLAHAIQIQKIKLVRLTGRLRPEGLERHLHQSREKFHGLEVRCRRAFDGLNGTRRGAFEAQAILLGSLSYPSVLERGFALVRDGDSQTVRRAAQVLPGALLALEFADGHVGAQALDVQIHDVGAQNDGKTKPETAKVDGTRKQGSLFR